MSPTSRRGLLGLAAAAPLIASEPASGATAACEPMAGGLGLADYRRYLAAFNAGDLDTACGYMAADMLFEGTGRRLAGRDAFRTYYAQLMTRIRERVSPRRVCFGDDSIAVEMETELNVLEDWPDFATGPVRRGDVIRVVTFVFYVVEAGKFTHIRSARFARQSERA